MEVASSARTHAWHALLARQESGWVLVSPHAMTVCCETLEHACKMHGNMQHWLFKAMAPMPSSQKYISLHMSSARLYTHKCTEAQPTYNSNQQKPSKHAMMPPPPETTHGMKAIYGVVVCLRQPCEFTSWLDAWPMAQTIYKAKHDLSRPAGGHSMTVDLFFVK